MADLEVREAPLVEFSSAFGGGTENKVSNEFYNSLLDKINAAATASKNNGTEDVPLTEDAEVEDLLQETLTQIFGGESGVSFKDSFAILTSEDKTELTALVTKFLNSIQGEIDDKTNNGDTQKLIDSLFPSDEKEKDPFDSVREQLAQMQKSGATSEELMQVIIPLIIQASTASTEKTYTYDVLELDGKKMTLDELQQAMQEIASMIAEVNAAPVTPETPEENPDGTVGGVTETPDGETGNTGETGETEGTTGGTEVTDGTAGTTGETGTAEGTEGTSGTTEIPQTTDTTETPQTTEIPQTTEVPVTTDETEADGNVGTISELDEILSQVNFIRSAERIQRGTNELSEIAAASQNFQPAAVSTEVMTEETAQSVQSQVLNFVSEELNTLENGTTREVTMTLNPENLGRITVHIESSDNEITIRIAAQSAETQELLRDRLPSLMQNH